MSTTLGPRVVLAGTHSGVGKTSVTTGVARALTRRGVRVATAKVGPDYIDPGYHSVACGRAGRNLDPWLCGVDAIGPLAGRAGADADVLVIEGVMGLFDGSGAAEDPSFASTAHVAALLDAPVVLVVDAASMSTSVAALVSGFREYDPRLTLRGVVLNRVGSDGHETLLRRALEPLGIPVVGALHRSDAFRWRDRHLGLVPVVEHAAQVAASVDTLAAAVDAQLDLETLLRIARGAPPLPVDEPPRPEARTFVRVAVASGPAFSFCYPDNLEALAAAGAELVPFDPHVDEALPPAVDGMVAGGGFPEVYAAELAANEPLLADVRTRMGAGLVTWAECGGLLWLSRALDDADLVGAVPAEARMTDRLTLGYRTAEVRADCPVGPAGSRLRGHEFHYSTLDPPGNALELAGRTGTSRGGYASPTLLASYLHVHLGGDPVPAERFVAACAR